IGNGTITGGAGTRSITFQAGASGSVTLNVTVQQGSCSAMGSKSVTIDSNCAASFFTVTPCRVADTRDPVGPYGGPALAAGVERAFVLASRCGIPLTAKAVSVNVTVTQPAAPGFVVLYPG